MVRIELPDIPTTDRLIEALHIAAGARPGTPRAHHWRRLAHDIEQALDNHRPEPTDT